MFAIYNERGRHFRSTLEDLYRVEGITRTKAVNPLVSEEQEDSAKNYSALSSKVIEAYKETINAKHEEPIYHASQIMKRPVLTVFEDTPLQQCYELLEKKGIKQLPVLNDEEKPVGMITKENLLKVVLIENNRVSHSEIDSIRTIISQPMITADPVADIRRVAKVMYDKKLNCIPITNKIDQIVGIITRTDIIHAVSTFPAITLWA